MLLLGLTTETWAIVAATALGPVIAILITRWRDVVRDKRIRRLQIFRSLLATRRQAITPEHVNSLNLIEIEFYGASQIENAWRAYLKHLNSPSNERMMTPHENKIFEDGRNDLLAKLLFSIGKSLGFTMSEIDLRNGGYAPTGWQYRDEKVTAVQEFIIDLAAGRKGLPIIPLEMSPPGRSTD